MRRREEAIEAILQAISIFENPEVELEGENSVALVPAQ
jgi:hypothetical protein